MLSNIPLSNGLGLRITQAEDQAFMEALFRSTREYLYQAIPGQFIDTLFSQQYQLQQASYVRQWPDAHTLIIQLSARAIGKIILDENKTALHIVDFAIEPGMRCKGYGTSILQAVQASAAKRGLRIQLSVDRQNLPAKKLYRRLGFQVDKLSDTHESMIWLPAISSGDAVSTLPRMEDVLTG